MHVKIVGSGPTGALLALALSRVGSKVGIYDYTNKQDLLRRSRAYALTHSSRRLLEDIGLWPLFHPVITPFDSLSLEDRQLLLDFKFSIRDLSSQNYSYGSIGWIIDHKIMMQILLSRIDNDSNIECNYGVATNSLLEGYDLIVAADGPNSSLRQEWNINTFNFSYAQGCLTTKVLVRGAKENVSHEIFRRDGPLALLPMGGETYQIVWTAPLESCVRRSSLKTSYLLDELAGILPDHMHPDMLLDQPNAFPLRFSIASSFGSKRHLLIGESAHCFHPVGGQGLNLCWRDVETLMRIIKRVNSGKVKLSSVPYIYNFRRYFDVIFTGLLTDLILRFYSNNYFYVLPFRRMVMFFVSYVRPLRRLLLRIMTDGAANLLL